MSDSALYEACKAAKPDELAALLDQPGAKDLLSKPQPPVGLCPLHVACGADRTEKPGTGGLITPEHVRCAELLLDAGADPNVTADSDWRPIHYAAIRGSPELVKLLIERQADAAAKNAGGWSGYALANKHGHAEAARLCAEAGASKASIGARIAAKIGFAHW
ncbi:unnamed protein product [Pedinophyceae sp. YPF-701]|nr:unnamed protein product [Pedinophyceae sp. YPF-701]